MASGGDWISNVTSRAFAGVSGNSRRFTDCRLVAWVGIANSARHALDFRQWIASVARRTLALGLVVLGNADGVFSAGLGVAHVVTSVVLTVAKLVRGTVHVIDARHLFAARGRVVGVSGEQSWRTLAAGDVVVDHADRLWPALHTQTSWETAKYAVNFSACFRLQTLSICGALVFESRFASITIVGVSSEAR